MQLLLVLLGALALFWVVSALSRELTPDVRRRLLGGLAVLLVLVGVVLALRLGAHWLALAGAGVWTVLRRLVPWLVRLAPLGFKHWSARRRASGPHDHRAPGGPPASGMSRAEALEVLGLDEGASNAEVLQAYKRLIQQVHPDKPGGSQYLASKVNQAKSVLLA